MPAPLMMSATIYFAFMPRQQRHGVATFICLERLSIFRHAEGAEPMLSPRH
jgi:hypothetical protein